jgi:hypothetical protein
MCNFSFSSQTFFNCANYKNQGTIITLPDVSETFGVYTELQKKLSRRHYLPIIVLPYHIIRFIILVVSRAD